MINSPEEGFKVHLSPIFVFHFAGPQVPTLVKFTLGVIELRELLIPLLPGLPTPSTILSLLPMISGSYG